MRYRALDENGDMVVRNGQAYLQDGDACAQACATRLRLLIYEWWEDIRDGIPWWQQIIATRDINEALRIIKKRVEGTERVIAVLAMDHQWNNETRELKIHMAVQSSYGIFELDETLGNGEV